MSILKRSLLAAGCLFMLPAVWAQDKLPVKFGKVTPEDFNVAVTDSSAGAIVIADFGTSTMEGDNSGGISVTFRHSCRIKLLKRSAFEDAATVRIPLFISGNKIEKVISLKAATYTLENGKVTETRLDDKSVFTDQLDKQHAVKKFTFPALKEGAIIEYTYTQVSPFYFNLQPWEFQGEYPCLWSEYQADMPHFLQFVILAHGYVPFKIHTTEERSVTFHLTIPGGAGADDHVSLDDNVVTHRWVMKNVPALKEEAYTTNVDNYLSRLEFQLQRYNWPDGTTKEVMGNWMSVSEGLLAASDFGADLDKNNGWLDDELKTVTNGAGTPIEKARRMYTFIRDNFNCTSHSHLYLSDGLKTVFHDKHGSEADLNLLLTAMLRHEKLTADPIILSTRSNGSANEIYPLLSRFNYVICRLTVDGTSYYLDASEPWLGFGRLPERCYNGYARVLNKENPTYVSLEADSMKESKTTLVILNNDETGGLSGEVMTTPGFNEACVVREKIRLSGRDKYMKKLQSGYTGEYAASDLEIDSLRRPDDPLKLSYELKIKPDSSSDLFYFNPMLGEGYKENPFKSAERVYPVEMPFTMDEVYTLNMEIPKGYVVDEVPKQARVTFNDNDGFFEYLLAKSDQGIQFRSRIKLNKANFKPEDYATLRDFFAFIVKKQSEQIVFKKKKSV
jgi:uncharacterized protein DUF3857/uncharacterized protein DUF3858/transglutaminase superfamily protein